MITAVAAWCGKTNLEEKPITLFIIAFNHSHNGVLINLFIGKDVWPITRIGTNGTNEGGRSDNRGQVRRRPMLINKNAGRQSLFTAQFDQIAW